ncbi:hypothetical protein HNR40_010578 [Nonomuraea endophytica]|uniref:Uncharacterized protein n=1 Tax=Nonomuraea endophytica TaxID=714136 RepID=A0A7W8AF90_9ACTN|nr:hypothetical protein [Nonomuraea endophytica]
MVPTRARKALLGLQDGGLIAAASSVGLAPEGYLKSVTPSSSTWPPDGDALVNLTGLTAKVRAKCGRGRLDARCLVAWPR